MDDDERDESVILFADTPKNAPRWSPNAAGDLIAFGGLRIETARRWARHCVYRGHVYPVSRGPGGAELDAAGVATVKILAVLNGAGIMDAEVCRAASLAMNAWNDSAQQRFPGRSPIWAALQGAQAAAKGETAPVWGLEIRTYRHDMSGQRHIFAVCYWIGGDKPEPRDLTEEPGWDLHAVTSVLLHPHLVPLVRRIEAALQPRPAHA